MDSARLFAILLSEDCQHKDVIGKRISERYPRHFKYSDFAFLAAIDSKVQIGEVAKAIGLYGPDYPKGIKGASGVVLKLNKGYAGYTNEDLWEWLDSQKEAERR